MADRLITTNQIQELHGLASKAGMDHDALHDLVCGLTESTSIKDLSNRQVLDVIAELQRRSPMVSRRRPSTPKSQSSSGGMSTGQQGMVWRLMYELQSYDKEPNNASLGQRLAGVVSKQFGIDSFPNCPMKWLGFTQGNKLIETLKRYVYNAATKR